MNIRTADSSLEFVSEYWYQFVGSWKVSFLLSLQLIMTGIAVLVVDRLGRRPLLLGGVSGIVSICFFFVYSSVWMSVFTHITKKRKRELVHIQGTDSVVLKCDADTILVPPGLILPFFGQCTSSGCNSASSLRWVLPGINSYYIIISIWYFVETCSKRILNKMVFRFHLGQSDGWWYRRSFL